MIKIMKYGEVSPEEIFARVETYFDVADIVTDIIDNVKKRGDQAVFRIFCLFSILIKLYVAAIYGINGFILIKIH